MIKRALVSFDEEYLNRILYRTFKSRKAHIYCMGTPKSGTHSIAHIFKGALRFRHEPNREELRTLFFKIKKGAINDSELIKIVEEREKKLYLELNSSCYNYIIVGELVKLYPEAKFILPIRHPYSWLGSWINHEINHRSDKIHQKFESYFREIFKQDELSYAPQESLLKEMKLPTIEGMLSYWYRHNKHVLDTVPDNQLLILRTKNISDSINSIINFAGLKSIPENNESHVYKASKKHNVLDSIDENFLEQKLKKYTAEFNNWI